MRTINNALVLLSVGIGFLTLAGCSVGNAPEGMSPSQTRAAVDALPPQQQIDYIGRSPLPAAEKQKRIDAIKAAHGIK